MDSKTKQIIKPLFIIAVFLFAISIAAFVFMLCSLNSNPYNMKIALIIASIATGLTIIFIGIILAAYFKIRKKQK